MANTTFTIHNEHATPNVFTQLHAFVLDERFASGTYGLNVRRFYFFENVFSIYIQGVSRLVNITAGGDFLGPCDQKSSYKHMSDFGQLRSCIF